MPSLSLAICNLYTCLFQHTSYALEGVNFVIMYTECNTWSLYNVEKAILEGSLSSAWREAPGMSTMNIVDKDIDP